MDTTDPRDFRRRTTTQPIGIDDGAKLKRCHAAAGGLGVDHTDLWMAVTFILGYTDQFTATAKHIPWERIESITILEDVA